MLEKIIKSKITFIVLISIMLILVIILFFSNKNDNPIGDDVIIEEKKDSINFILIGDREIHIYKGYEYEDLGFRAILNNKTNLEKYVEVENNVNIDEVGTYEVIYRLKYNDIDKTLERKVIVEDIPLDQIVLSLNGSEKIYVSSNSEYEEFGAEAYFNNEDISDKIVIEEVSDLEDLSHYYIKYSISNNDSEKEIRREIVLLDIDNMFNVDIDNLQIQITLDDNISYIELPNQEIKMDQVITYNIIESGEYEFKLYTNNNQEFTKIIEIDEEDIKAPTGTCNATLYDGKTTVKVKASGNIIKYIYNGVESESNNYQTDSYLREVNVKLVSNTLKETEIKCDVKMEYLPVREVVSGSKLKRQASTDSLKVKVVYYKGIYLAYVWVKDANNQFYKKHGYNYPPNSLESAVKSNNLKNKLVLGFTASVGSNEKAYNWPEPWKNKEPSPLMITNGTIQANVPTKSVCLFISYIDSSNQLRFTEKKECEYTTEERKEIFQTIIDSGTRNTMVWRPILVSNYKAVSLSASFLKQEAAPQRKQALCQLDTNNFIVAVSETSTAGNITYPNFQKFLVNLGCKTAVEYDGGGSTSLLWKPNGTTSVTRLVNGYRKLSAIGYFREE